METTFKTWNQEKDSFKEELNELLAHESSQDDYTREELVESWQDDGQIHELVDRSISIYYYNLRLWSVDHYQYIEEAMEEFGNDLGDWHATIQRGQYLYYSEVMQDAIDEWIEETN